MTVIPRKRKAPASTGVNNNNHSSTRTGTCWLCLVALFVAALSSIGVIFLTDDHAEQDLALAVAETTRQIAALAARASGSSLTSTSTAREILLSQGGVTIEQIDALDRSKPIYVDLGFNDGTDTKFYLQHDYTVVAVDAYKPFIEQAHKRYLKRIRSGQLLLAHIAVGPVNLDSVPMYFKKAGDPIASFVREKGCQGAAWTRACKHMAVPMVQCSAIVTEIVQKAPALLRSDIEMMHHSCIRGLQELDSALLPKTVCWQEHDRPFGSAHIPRPITDVKLMLSLYELGYDTAKVVLMGINSWKYYHRTAQSSNTKGSGDVLPDDMVHYRSYEYHKTATTATEKHETPQFDTDWVPMQQIFKEGLFGFGTIKQPSRSTYFDICMKLGDNNADLRKQRQWDQRNLPLANLLKIDHAVEEI